MEQAAFGGSIFSSTVHLWLEAGDLRVPLAQVASDFVIAAEPIDLPAGPAVVAVSIDGRVHRRTVSLPHGMTPDNPRSIVAAIPDEPPF